MGNKENVPAGEFQIMSAGTGITHSEYNPNSDKGLHFYQIWIMPNTVGITPRYDQRRFDTTVNKQLILSPDARDGSLKVFQDMTLWRWNLKKGEEAQYKAEAGRHVWLQVVKGKITINDIIATTSDGVAIANEDMIRFVGDEDSEILLFDLPPVTA